MSRKLHHLLILVTTSSVIAKKAVKPDLPPCPINVGYLPQDLPMHCRMTRSAGDPPNFPDFPTFPPPFFQSPSPGKQPAAVPFGAPPAFGVPPMPFPGPMIPGPPSMPGAMPMPGMPMGVPGLPMPAAHKLPVIVMPFYSPDPAKDGGKKPPKRYRKPVKSNSNAKASDEDDDDDSSDDDDSDDDDDDSDETRRNMKPSKRKNRRNNNNANGVGKRGHRKGRSRSQRRAGHGRGRRQRQRRGRRPERGRERKIGRLLGPTRRTGNDDHPQLLTPVIQYMTKDGYVIYEKEITKNEAREWLNVKNKEDEPDEHKVTYTEIDDANEHDAEEISDHKVLKIKDTVVAKSPSKSKLTPLKLANKIQNHAL